MWKPVSHFKKKENFLSTIFLINCWVRKLFIEALGDTSIYFGALIICKLCFSTGMKLSPSWSVTIHIMKIERHFSWAAERYRKAPWSCECCSVSSHIFLKSPVSLKWLNYNIVKHNKLIRRNTIGVHTNRVLKWWRHKNDFSGNYGFNIRMFGTTCLIKVHTQKIGSLVH